MTTITNPKPRTQNLALPIVLVVLVIVGMAAWIVQLTQGFGMLGIGQEIVWGLYIAAFFLLLGTGCALLLFTAGGDLGLLPRLQPHRRTLLAFALGMFIAGGLAILMDIGRPARVLNLLFSPQWKSPFIWDFYGLIATVVVTAVYFFARPKGKTLPWIAAIVAALVVIIEGWILGVLAARPLWHGGLVPVLFFLEALISGAAFVVLVLGEGQPWARKSLAWLLVVFGVVTLVDAAALLFSGPTGAREAMGLLFSGSLAASFWAQMLLGIGLPIILLAGLPANRGAALSAAVLAILGVLFSKLNLMTAGQATPLMGPAASYTPGLVEVGGVLGVVALALLIGTLGPRLIRAKAQE
jgi:molybdopterin-containing oxidoreductase family membrane subunit